MTGSGRTFLAVRAGAGRMPGSGRSAGLGMALLVLIVCGALSPLQAAEPWSFPGGDRDKKSAEKRYGTYWQELYVGALQQLKQANPDYKEVIERLRLAISYQADSGILEDQRTQMQVEYFPYHYLAQAFLKTRDFKSADRCAQRENQLQKIKSSKLASAQQNLVATIDSLVGAQDLLGLAGEVLTWEAGAKDMVLLSPDSAARLKKVRSLADKIGEPGPDTTRIYGELKEELFQLCKGETQVRGAVLDQLLGDQWKQALTAPGDRPDPSVCQTPPYDGKVEAVQGGMGALKKCNAAVVQGTRRAGAWGCTAVASLRSGVEESSATLREWAKLDGTAAPAQEAPPALPQMCGATRWTEATPSRLLDAFKALDAERGKLTPALEARKKDIDGRLNEKRAQLRDRLGKEQASVPALPADCAQALGLGPIAASLSKFRADVSPDRVPEKGLPPKELFQPARSIDSLLKELVARSREGAQALQQKTNYPDLPKENLGRLQTTVAKLGPHPAPAEIQSLCAITTDVNGDIRAWVKRNIPFLTAEVARYADLLDVAGRSQALSGLLPCLSSRASELSNARKGLQGANPSDWVDRAQTSTVGAQACLTDLHTKSGETFAAIGGRVQRAQTMLDQSFGPTAAASARGGDRPVLPSLPCAAGIKDELLKAKTLIDGVAALYKSPPAAAQVRQALEKAGLASAVSDRAGQVLDASAGKKDGEAEAVLVVRDAAVLPSLLGLETTLGRAEPCVQKLGPFAALNRAYGSFGDGDLDGAIRALREAQQHGLIPSQGKESAVAHAALAYFLHTKGAALLAAGHGDRAAESLSEDVRQESLLAVRADANFRLPESLFPSQSFRKSFEDYSKTETR